MLVSTRGRYALRVMVDLAQHQDQGLTPMKDVAQRQQISLKYLEKILPVLSKHHYISGTQGKGGGYQLTRPPEEYRVGDILRLTEGDLAPVSCLEAGAPPASSGTAVPPAPCGASWGGGSMSIWTASPWQI